ncbi:uncharacterized protein LOC142152430 [Mixophyes fleayi]|uniref:uncharacterized protein LOC142152430 n=1 Tax=Mixophyes fleayi TaxID=3061075 RepID=UPI003F4DECBC
MSLFGLAGGRTGIIRLAETSLAPSTRRAYRAAWLQWRRFLQSHGRCDSGQSTYMLDFIWAKYQEGITKNVMAAMLAGISFMAKLHGWTDFTKGFLISKALKGWSKLQPGKEDVRRPVDKSILRKIMSALAYIADNAYEVLLFSSAFSLAFFGAFRVSELVAQSKHDLGNALSARHMFLDVNMLSCQILRSKRDQSARGQCISISAQEDSEICPVSWCNKFEKIRPRGAEPWLVHADKSPLSKFQFTDIFKRALVYAGLDPSRFGTHSFRIGAATAAAEEGSSVSAIKALGRWRSDAYKTYIRQTNK